MRDMLGNGADTLSRLRPVVGDNGFGLAAIERVAIPGSGQAGRTRRVAQH